MSFGGIELLCLEYLRCKMGSYWEGDKSLGRAFWIIWFAGSFGMAAVPSLLVYLAGGGVYILFPFFNVDALALFPFIIFVYILVYNPYYIYCWVSVWRCSENSKSQYLIFSVKVLVALHAIFTIYNILDIFL